MDVVFADRILVLLHRVVIGMAVRALILVRRGNDYVLGCDRIELICVGLGIVVAVTKRRIGSMMWSAQNLGLHAVSVRPAVIVGDPLPGRLVGITGDKN